MKRKIKVGDRVRNTNHYNDGWWPKGYEFTVTSVSENGFGDYIYGDCKDGTNGCILREHCELIDFNKTKEKTMINFHVLDHSIALNYLGKTVVISEDDSRFEPVLQAIKDSKTTPERLNDIPAIVETEKSFEGTGFELRDGILYQDENPIPPELNERILKYKEKGIPYDSLVKFWENLKLNPSYNSRQQLFAFLKHNNHPLTESGEFIAYRGVSEEFKDLHTGQFDNSVGAVCEMSRELVDDNPTHTCSRGLHVACFDYAKGFGPKLIEVKVNPRDVVCVPTDYNGTKMRTCRFEVVAVGEKPRTETVYGLDEAAQEVEDGYSEGSDDKGYDGESDSCPSCDADKDAFHNFCPECGHDFND